MGFHSKTTLIKSTTMNVSFFNHIKTATPKATVSVLDFLSDVKNGKYIDGVISFRNEKDEKKRKEIKASMPAITVSGVFSERRTDGVKTHSGLIAIDFDDFENELFAKEAKNKVLSDPYVFAAAISCGGKGFFVIVKIPKCNPEDHSEYAYALFKHFFEVYGLTADAVCSDITRTRTASYDPALFLNENSETWQKKLPKPKKETQKEIDRLSATRLHIEDMEFIVSQIEEKGLSIMDDYESFRNISFAIASEFGEDGRDFFHRIASLSNRYNRRKEDKFFDYFLNGENRNRETKITIGSFLHLCHSHGIKTMTELSKKITSQAISQKRAGCDEASVLKKFANDGISEDRAKDIVTGVFAREKNYDPKSNEPPLIRLKNWVSEQGIRYNTLTKYLEYPDRTEIQDMEMNSLFVNFIIETFGGEEKLSFRMFKTFLTSKEIPSYNPAREYFETLSKFHAEGHIKQLADALSSPTGWAVRPDYVEHFLRKWLVGLVAASFGEPTDTMLVLTGEKVQTGKSQFFRQLLPVKLQKYYAETRFERGKDDEILACSNMLIFVDDAISKNLSMTGELKSFITKEIFTLRRPYAAAAEKMRKVCAIGASTNELKIIDDVSGNRRIISFEITERIHEKCVAVDKMFLFVEVYHLFLEWKAAKKWLLTEQDVVDLQAGSCAFEVNDYFMQMIDKHVVKSEFNVRTSGDILQGIWERTKMTQINSITTQKVEKVLKRKGFVHNGKGYLCKFVDEF